MSKLKKKNTTKTPNQIKPGWFVSKEDVGLKLPVFIKSKLNNIDLSLRNIKTLMEKGACEVNGKIEKFASRSLREGDTVVFKFDADLVKSTTTKFEIAKKDIIYEDEVLLVYDKPAGLSCGKNKADPKNNLHQMLEEFLSSSLEMVHRLDKDTSGVMIFSKTSEITIKLLDLFKSREMVKTYLAIVDGVIEDDEGVINDRLFMKSKGPGWEKWAVTKKQTNSKSAVTHYRKVDVYKNKTCLLELKPETGRTHQIRVHLESIGHPIIGDHFYGNSFDTKIMTTNHLLHASALELIHPLTNEKITFKSSFPERFKKAIAKLKK